MTARSAAIAQIRAGMTEVDDLQWKVTPDFTGQQPTLAPNWVKVRIPGVDAAAMRAGGHGAERVSNKHLLPAFCFALS